MSESGCWIPSKRTSGMCLVRFHPWCWRAWCQCVQGSLRDERGLKSGRWDRRAFLAYTGNSHEGTLYMHWEIIWRSRANSVRNVIVITLWCYLINHLSYETYGQIITALLFDLASVREIRALWPCRSFLITYRGLDEYVDDAFKHFPRKEIFEFDTNLIDVYTY